jgi:hypothetical protein
LLAALASINPDSTIRVRAAYQSSSKQRTNLKQDFPNHIVENHGYADIKNCLYYFAADASEINNGQSLGNSDDIYTLCLFLSLKIGFPITSLTILSDSRLSGFLSLYKSSYVFLILMILNYNFCAKFFYLRMGLIQKVF